MEKSRGASRENILSLFPGQYKVDDILPALICDFHILDTAWNRAVRAELYRVDDALTLGGERLVSDTAVFTISSIDDMERFPLYVPVKIKAPVVTTSAASCPYCQFFVKRPTGMVPSAFF